ncbi:MAG: transglutaminase family protein, partial [Chthoniobacterales bacterium]|nr:transglutaminase family protein [Chthoniobacterales bacterium]
SLNHKIVVNPTCPSSPYTDWFGNYTHFCAMVAKHQQVDIINNLLVQTSPPTTPQDALDLTIAESRQLFNSQLHQLYDFLLSTPVVPVGGIAKRWASRFFKPNLKLGHALLNLTSAIHKHFQYLPGATNVKTPLPTVWKQKKGVCQDFAHIMLSILRTAGIPCRYVCGYIENAPPLDTENNKKPLLGSSATHAWVEVLLPGGYWLGLDPTNNCISSQQHIPVSRGRDFREAAPVIGTFKTSGSQNMTVKVTVKRISTTHTTRSTILF